MSPIITGSGAAGGAISGVTVTGTAASGQVPVASSAAAGAWGYPPGFEVGYDQITSNVTVAGTTEAAGTTVISAAAHTFDGAAVLCHFFALLEPATGGSIIVCLFEAATEITRLASIFSGTGVAAEGVTVSAFYRFTPTAAAHTYTVTAFRTVGNGTLVAGLGGTAAEAPAFLRFTKV